MGDSSKRLVKDLARPLLRPLVARIAYLRERIDTVDAQLQSAQGRLAEVERQAQVAPATLNQLLDAMTTQNALARETRRNQVRLEEDHATNLRSIWETEGRFAEDLKLAWETQTKFANDLVRLESRLEFIRREIMVEVQSGAQRPGTVPTTDPKVINAAKLHSRPLRLNLGCGHLPADDCVNVDGRPLPGVDLIADVDNLPLEPGSVDEIRSSHLLEHFPEARLRELLQYWYDLLRGGGLFRAVVPDADSMIRAYVSGDSSWQDLKEVTFGAQDYAGDFHFTMLSQDDLITLLRSAGFASVEVVEAGRRNGACLEMEVAGLKPEGG